MSAPRARKALDGIPLYRAGKAALTEEHKLSSNENPYAPLPGVMERAAAELGRMNRYPDAGMTTLYDALAKRLGLSPDHFAAGTGSVAVLFSLLNAHLEDGDEIVHAWRSFEAYPIAIDLTGATAVRVPLRPDAGHDLDAMADAITERTKVVLVCTPNNPTGPVVTAAELRSFLARVPDHVMVVIDEAYVEFVRDPAAAKGLDALADHDNVVVLRTFSKAYGLAGLRVGYAIARPEVAESIRKATPPFTVTDVAQAAAVASLDAQDALDERVELIVQERIAMVAALRAQGWHVPETEANFVWLPLDEDAISFSAACDPVSVRPFAGEGVRISVGTPAVNAQLIELAGSWRTRNTA
ncbi:histidinol-phosphate transaminase [Aeromicrobium chenweiae]|uniref:Aromatic amino acid aminotransferase n=1 Tax=Aeromicrobium chenweiae TaxID=2079793 RepID=A0A2S0WR73_9ACTN|nr:histidinol-phosphate transaminase [Aeromicrobium chenweiae]AWB93817.1 histidinol-phosphate transaminase [Aeromicrobium chenweiae]TGN30862.1 histidinol-phosphate transaminase [Aeromicrobium chenweiae]